MVSEVSVPVPPNEKRGGKGRTLHTSGETIKDAEGGAISAHGTVDAGGDTPLRPPVRSGVSRNVQAEAQAVSAGFKRGAGRRAMARAAGQASRNPEQVRSALKRDPGAFTLLGLDGIGG